jgi:hypothetical protein
VTPNDIEVMAAARTMSDNKRRLTMAGFRMVARERMVRFPLGPLPMVAIAGHIRSAFHGRITHTGP